MAFKRVQSTFSGGLHSQSLNTSINLEQYYTGLKQAKNVIITPQGGIKRRWGNERIKDLNDSNGENVVFQKFSVRNDLKLILLFSGRNIFAFTKNINRIYDYVSASADIENFSSYVNIFDEDFDARDLDFAQSLNSLIITHKDFAPKLLSCLDTSSEEAALDSIQLEDLEFKHKPTFDFEDDKSPINEDFQAKFTVERGTGGDIQSDIFAFQKNKFRVSLDGKITNWIKFASDDKLEKFTPYDNLATYLNLSYQTGTPFKIKFVDRKSRYVFKNDKKIKYTVNSDKNNFDNFDGYEDFIYSGTDLNEFIEELSVELNKMFFYETYGVVLKDTYLRSTAIDKRPIIVSLKSGTAFDDFTIKITHYIGMDGSDTFYGANETQDYRDTDGTLLTNQSVKYNFVSWGDYIFEGNCINKIVVAPDENILPFASVDFSKPENLYIQNNESLEHNNCFLKTYPHDIMFRLKKEIELLEVIQDMRNVYISTGIEGIYAPFGGGNCPVKSTKDLQIVRKNYMLLGISQNGWGRDRFVDQNENPPVINNILDNPFYFDHENHIDSVYTVPNSVQTIAFGSRVALGLTTINVRITGKDAKDYPFDLDVGDGNEGLLVLDYPNISITKEGGDIKEDAFSNERGWPSKTKYIENRLVFANTKELPDAMWFSEQDNFFYFKEGEEPYSAINNVRPTQSTLNEINHIVGSKSLQVFTAGSEHYNPNAITPTEISLPEQSNFGSKSNVKPISIDNSTIYLDNNNNLRSFIYDDLQVSYKSVNRSILASDLLRDTPIKYMRPVKYKDTNYVFLITESGKIICYQTIQEQNISNFTIWESDYIKFLDVIEVDNTVFGVVDYRGIKRLIRFNEDYANDLEIRDAYNGNLLLKSSVYFFGNDRTNISSTYYSRFTIINKIANQEYLGEILVDNNYVTFEGLNEPVEYYDNNNYVVGLHFDAEIETKDVAYDIGRGQEIVGKKKFTRAWLSMYGTTGWNLVKNKIKYNPREYKELDGSDIKINQINGEVSLRLTGYHDRVNIKLVQDIPNPYGSLQAITLEIKT